MSIGPRAFLVSILISAVALLLGCSAPLAGPAPVRLTPPPSPPVATAVPASVAADPAVPLEPAADSRLSPSGLPVVEVLNLFEMEGSLEITLLLRGREHGPALDRLFRWYGGSPEPDGGLVRLVVPLDEFPAFRDGLLESAEVMMGPPDLASLPPGFDFITVDPELGIMDRPVTPAPVPSPTPDADAFHPRPTPRPEADLQVSLTALDPPSVYGRQSTYRVSVTNSGDLGVSDSFIRIHIDEFAGVRLWEGADCVRNTCPFGPIPSGAVVEREFSVLPSRFHGSLEFSVDVRGSELERAIEDNGATFAQPIAAPDGDSGLGIRWSATVWNAERVGLVDDRLYAWRTSLYGYRPYLAALNPTDGTLGWHVRLREADFPGDSWGGPIYTEPVFAGSVAVFALAPGDLIAVDLSSGTSVWEFQVERLDTPALAAGGGMVFVATADSSPNPVSRAKVYALDAETGALLWEWETPTPGWFIHGRAPVLADGLVFLSHTGDGGVLITALDNVTGEVRWVLPGWADQLTVARGSLLYVGSGAVRSVDIGTGEFRWAYGLKSGSGVPALTVAGGHLHVCDDDSLHSVDLDTGLPIWITPLTGECPRRGLDRSVVSGDTVVFATGSAVHGIDRLIGELLWVMPVSVGYEWPVPVVHDDEVYFSSGGGLVVADLRRGRILSEFPAASHRVHDLLAGRGRVYAVVGERVAAFY